MTLNIEARQFSKSVVASLLLIAWTLITMLWWGLAFFPVKENSPQWLVRTQYVCFGSMPNGLPAVFGWMVLVLGPLSLLLAMIVVYHDEMHEEWRRLNAGSLKKMAMLLLLVIFLAEAAWIVMRVNTALQVANVNYESTSPGALPATYPRGTAPAPEFRLIDQKGRTLSLENFKGKAIILTFAFAHCQAMCPTLMKNTLKAYSKVDHTQVSAVYITLDPWRDTPRSLPSVAKNWEIPDDAFLLSGSVKDVIAVLDRYKVPWQRDEKNGDVAHPGLVYVLDTMGRMAYTFNNPSVEWLVDATYRVIK